MGRRNVDCERWSYSGYILEVKKMDFFLIDVTCEIKMRNQGSNFCTGLCIAWEEFKIDIKNKEYPCSRSFENEEGSTA